MLLVRIVGIMRRFFFRVIRGRVILWRLFLFVVIVSIDGLEVREYWLGLVRFGYRIE